jgi:hypothetical protein
MPYLTELLAGLKFTRLLGQRPFGHYDHDATLIIGPPSCEATLAVPPDAGRQDLVQTAKPAETVTYEKYQEPRTGEVLYRVRGDSGAEECSR